MDKSIFYMGARLDGICLYCDRDFYHCYNSLSHHLKTLLPSHPNSVILSCAAEGPRSRSHPHTSKHLSHPNPRRARSVKS